MKKIILFLLLFINLFADYLYIGYYMDAVNYKGTVFFDVSNSSRCYEYNGKLYINKDMYMYSAKDSYPRARDYYPQFNTTCLSQHATRLCSYSHTSKSPDVAGVWSGDYLYCLPPQDQGSCSYSSSLQAWVCVKDEETNVICPEGQIYNDTTAKCEDAPECDLTCPTGQILDKINCVCKCPSPMTSDGLGHCVPDTSLNKDDCEAAGGVYMDNNILDTFSNINNAIVSLYAPPGEHYCYSSSWAEAKKEALSAKFSPKEILSSAVSLLPVSKAFKLARWAGLTDRVIEEIKTPKALTDERPVIDTKYNPETGTFEPVINLEQRAEKLPEEKLFQNPGSLTEAEDIIKPTKELDDFLRSKFATDTIDTEQKMNEAIIAYDMDRGLQEGTQVKIIDDLRDLFKRSEVNTGTANFPVPLKDYVTPDATVPATVERQVTPVNTAGETKTYNVTYNITPQGAKLPVPITYEIEVKPDPQDSSKNLVKATPKYQVGNTVYTGTTVIVNNLPTTPNPNPNEENKDQNYTSFLPMAQNAITDAFNYKITLFTCPDVSPQCPHSIKVNYNLAGLKGNYDVPDPMCAVIEALDDPNISPSVDNAANFIVLFAGVLGALSLLRRD